MNISEFRINNIVEICFLQNIKKFEETENVLREFARITNLWVDGYGRAGISVITKEGHTFDTIINSDEIQQAHIKSIILTKEILLDCGFTLLNGYIHLRINDSLDLGFSLDNGVRECLRIKNNSTSEFTNILTNKNITELHSLMNIYYSITGEELKFLSFPDDAFGIKPDNIIFLKE